MFLFTSSICLSISVSSYPIRGLGGKSSGRGGSSGSCENKQTAADKPTGRPRVPTAACCTTVDVDVKGEQKGLKVEIRRKEMGKNLDENKNCEEKIK